MIKFMLEYIKENKGKAIKDIVFLIGLSAMTSMLMFIGYVFVNNLK